MFSVHNSSLHKALSSSLRESTQKESTALERLASGKRINSAADDAAGLQVSDRLTTSIISDTQVVRNLNDGISYAQIAEGALSTLGQNLQRMRELAVQAQSGIASDADRKALDEEFQQLKQEIDSIAYDTEAFGRHPLLGPNVEEDNLSNVQALDDVFTNGQSGSLSSGLQTISYIPAGASGIHFSINSLTQDDDIQLFTAAGVHLAGTALGDDVWDSTAISSASDMDSRFLLPNSGYNNDATYDASSLNTGGTSSYGGMNITYSGDGDIDNSGTISAGETPVESITIDSVTTPLVLSVVGSGSFSYTISWTDPGSTSPAGSEYGDEGDVRVTATNTPQADEDFVTLNKTPSSLEDLSLSDLALDPYEAAEAALGTLDSAIETVSDYRAAYGAKMNEMTSALRNTQQQEDNASATRSRILDTDYAKETATLAANQIVKQASTAMLSQANTQIERVLPIINSISES